LNFQAVLEPTLVRDHVLNKGIWLSDTLDAAAAEFLARTIADVDGAWTRLVHKSRKDASDRPTSLSGLYGLGPFPWHTDGASRFSSPDMILLHCFSAADNCASTELLDIRDEKARDVVTDLRRAVIRVKTSNGRGYLPALTRDATGPIVRWDPRVAAGQEAKRGCLLTHPRTSEIKWIQGRTVIIDNRRLLHRRPAVAELPGRLLGRLHLRFN
jgi:hypothetical protein